MSFATLIVGLGNIGLGYDLVTGVAETIKTHARAFHLHDRFEVVGGVDFDPSARQSFEKHYSRKSFACLSDALTETDPELVVVATPTHQHIDDVRTLVNHGAPRAILCEKPLSLNRDDASCIVSLCDENDVDLYANYIRRTDPAVLEIKARLDSGRIAKPVKGVAWYSKGFLHNCSHYFDLMNFWLGETTSYRVIDPGRRLQTGDSTPDVRVVFEDGSIDFLAVRDQLAAHSAAEFLSASGRLTYQKGGNEVLWYAAPNGPPDGKPAGTPPAAERIEAGLSRYQMHVAEQLASALDNKPNNLCSGKDALKTLEWMCAINEDCRE